MKRTLTLFVLFLSFSSFSQNCYELNVKFDPIIFSFCDSDDNCLSFDIYADENLIQSIDLDTINPSEIYNLCLEYDESCTFSASFEGTYNGFGIDIMYFQVFNSDGTSQNYNNGDTWQSENFCGCTYYLAENFDPEAIVDDGSCIAYGCTNPLAENYDEFATIENGTCMIFGCTDPNSFNYLPEAEFSDESCIDFEYGCIDTLAVNFDGNANTDDGSCSYCEIEVSEFAFNPTTPLSCDGFINLTVSSENFDVSWSNGMSGATLSLLCNDVYEYEITDENNCYASNEIVLTDLIGCTDQLALNYDNTAIYDDGSCIPLMPGCMDSTNTNFDPEANTDDGSCIDCQISILQVQVIDNTDNQCNGSAFVVASSAETEISYLWSDGTTNSFVSGLCTGIYTIEISDTTGCVLTQEITIGNIIYGCTDSTAINYSFGATIDDGSCEEKIIGCLDINANNYNSLANYPDICTYDVYGCTDSLATNYNPEANIELGNCNYPCLENEVIIVMYDNLGNGWGSGFYRIKNSNEQVVNVGTLEQGAYSTDTLCLPSDCYTFDILGAGIGSVEILWEVVYGGITIATGTGQSGYSFTINQCQVYGCTDSQASNFNTNATVDDNSCTYPIFGCTDQTALNYNSEATDDDQSCTYPIYGCMDSNATNFNSDATSDDGSCQYAENVCDIVPTGLFVDNIIHNRVVFNWSAPSAAPSHYMIRYRIAGTSSWTVMTAGPVNSNAFTGTSRTRYFMESGTTYEWSMRARVLNEDGSTNCQSSWSASSQYTTLEDCPNLDNLSASTEANWVTLSADASSSEWGVWQSKGKMRVVGTNSFRYVNGDENGNISTLKGNFTASTDYEWHTKAWCTGNVDSEGNSDPMYHSGWGDFSSFTTQDPCDKMPTNLSTGANGAQTAITMSWDTPESGEPDHYFLELTNVTTGQVWAWNNIAGSSNSKTKFGLTQGDYSWKIRGACGTNGTSWATVFSDDILFTLGGARFENSSVTKLEIYPNPSRDVFNISFTSQESQTITVKVVDMIGKEIFTEEMSDFNGSYNQLINLSNEPNGIYLLKINSQVIKLILQ